MPTHVGRQPEAVEPERQEFEEATADHQAPELGAWSGEFDAAARRRRRRDGNGGRGAWHRECGRGGDIGHGEKPLFSSLVAEIAARNGTWPIVKTSGWRPKPAYGL